MVDPQVLDISAAEDDVIVDLIRGRDLFVGVASATLAAEGLDILEGDGRVFGVDFMEDAGVARGELADGQVKEGVLGGHVPNVAH